MEELLTAISQVGFPIAISIYLLIRFEQKMEKLGLVMETEMDKLTAVIIEQNTTIKDQRAEIKELKEEVRELKEVLKERR